MRHTTDILIVFTYFPHSIIWYNEKTSINLIKPSINIYKIYQYSSTVCVSNPTSDLYHFCIVSGKSLYASAHGWPECGTRIWPESSVSAVTSRPVSCWSIPNSAICPSISDLKPPKRKVQLWGKLLKSYSWCRYNIRDLYY